MFLFRCLYSRINKVDLKLEESRPSVDLYFVGAHSFIAVYPSVVDRIKSEGTVHILAFSVHS